MGSSRSVERLWSSRLRWRMKGAWQWPAFFVLTLAGGVILDVLPFYESGPGTLLGGVLLAGFANLVLVAAVAPVAGWALRRRRPDLPRLVASDYAGTGLLCVLGLALLVGGLVHRPLVEAEQDARRAELGAVRAYVGAHAPEHRPWLALADTMRIEDGVYRTCVPGPDAKRPLCLFVETHRRPPVVRRDTDRAPNDAYRMHGGFR
jgi:hypothetical protein